MFTVQLKKSLKNIAKASDKLLALQLLYLVLLIKMIVNRQAPLGQQIELKNKWLMSVIPIIVLRINKFLKMIAANFCNC